MLPLKTPKIYPPVEPHNVIQGCLFLCSNDIINNKNLFLLYNAICYKNVPYMYVCVYVKRKAQ